MAGVGARSRPRPAAVIGRPARAAPVALVVFHRLALVAPDPRAPEGRCSRAGHRGPLTDIVAGIMLVVDDLGSLYER